VIVWRVSNVQQTTVPVFNERRMSHLLFTTFHNVTLASMDLINSTVQHLTTILDPTWLAILYKLPYIALYIVAGIVAVFIVLLAISACGFSSAGVVAGSLASLIQSMCHGGAVAAGSLFATCQSIGAAGPSCWLITLIFLIGGGLALFGIITWERWRKSG
jgi:hypothetical protein